MQPRDWLATAELLLDAGKLSMDGELGNVVLFCRATNTPYYARFHALSRGCAEMIDGPSPDQARWSWARVYRAIDPRTAKQACIAMKGSAAFSPAPQLVALACVDLQERRHGADYDPNWIVSESEVAEDIGLARRMLARLDFTPEEELRPFFVHLLFRDRR